MKWSQNVDANINIEHFKVPTNFKLINIFLLKKINTNVYSTSCSVLSLKHTHDARRRKPSASYVLIELGFSFMAI